MKSCWSFLSAQPLKYCQCCRTHELSCFPQQHFIALRSVHLKTPRVDIFYAIPGHSRPYLALPFSIFHKADPQVDYFLTIASDIFCHFGQHFSSFRFVSFHFVGCFLFYPSLCGVLGIIMWPFAVTLSETRVPCPQSLRRLVHQLLVWQFMRCL